MQKYDAIEKGISNNDVKALREAIGSICYTNRDFSNGEFFDVVEYVEKNGIHLKDAELVGSPTISSQKNEFTDEDFAKAIFELKKNFCDARIEDVKTIGQKLYGKKSKIGNTESSNPALPKQNVSDSSGIHPNAQSHQQNKQVTMMLSGVAIIVIIMVIILLAMK